MLGGIETIGMIMGFSWHVDLSLILYPNGVAQALTDPLTEKVVSLKMGEEWRHLRGKEPHADWEVYPTTPWNYALQLAPDHPERSLHFVEGEVGDCPFSPEGAPIRATVQGRRIATWEVEHNAAAPPPVSPVISDAEPEELTLIPYGCTNLRVTELPLLRQNN